MKRNSVNDNFTNILNFINSSEHEVSYVDLLQYCIDYDQYKEYYLNYPVFKDILLEHNEKVRNASSVDSALDQYSGEVF